MLTYEWGSANHKLAGHSHKSSEAPDDAGQVSVAIKMQQSAGKYGSGSWFYPRGPMTDLLYDVRNDISYTESYFLLQ
jgi:hypothetical protein